MCDLTTLSLNHCTLIIMAMKNSLNTINTLCVENTTVNIRIRSLQKFFLLSIWGNVVNTDLNLLTEFTTTLTLKKRIHVFYFLDMAVDCVFKYWWGAGTTKLQK